MGAAEVRLSGDEIKAVRKISEESDIPGDRYAKANMQFVLVNTPPLQKQSLWVDKVIAQSM